MRGWTSVICASVCVLFCYSGRLSAVDSNASEEAKRIVAELKDLVNRRDMDKYELDIQVEGLQRIVLPYREFEHGKVYHYVIFRLRNRVSDSARFLEENTRAFNEVMNNIVAEYEGVSYDQAGGAQLAITDLTEVQDEQLKTIVEREDLRVKKRRVRIAAEIEDENGTRHNYFDASDEAPSDQGFTLDDQGQRVVSSYFYRAHQAIEEKEGRRLHTIHQIRDMELPPYNASKRDQEGVAQGEINGVLLFERLPLNGDFFTLKIHGLSNKLRYEIPPQDNPQALENYVQTIVKRRTYLVHFERRGDEFFLDQDPFVLTKASWEWVPSFQRLRHRASAAYSKYFLENIRKDPKDTVVNTEIEQQFWAYFSKERNELLPKQLTDKKARLLRQTKKIKAYYDELIAARDDEAEKAKVEATLKTQLQTITDRISAIDQQLSRLPDDLIDFQKKVTAGGDANGDLLDVDIDLDDLN